MTDYEEIIEDAALKSLVDRGVPVTFVVLEDEWNADYTVRTIKRAEIKSSDTPIPHP